jgi:hypothetical protein
MLQKLVNNRIYLLLFLGVISYWYNLPILYYSVLGNNEIRLYDLVFFFLLINFIKQFRTKYQVLLRLNKSLKYFYEFCLFCTFSTVITLFSCVILGRMVWFLQTFLYLYHLWGFFVVAITFMGIEDDNSSKFFINTYLVCAVIAQVIILMQVAGIMPILWKEIYVKAYGDKNFTGTLGPNRVCPSMSIFYSFALSFFLLANADKFKTMLPKLLASIILILSPVVVIMTSSQTSTYSLFLFILINVVVIIRKPIFLIGIVLLILVGSIFAPAFIVQRVNYVIEDRITTKLKGEEDDLNDYYESLGSGRAEILAASYQKVLDNLPFLVTGMGFNNRILFGQGSSAHNIYFSLLFEVGLFGLFFYLRWLFGCINPFTHIKKKRLESITHLPILALIVVTLLSLIAGEHLYIYRPLFGLLGNFLLVNAFFFRIGYKYNINTQ